MNVASILFYLPLTLPIDGAAWGAQFAGWGALDWGVLLGLACVAYPCSGTLMQVRSGWLFKWLCLLLRPCLIE